MTRILMDVEQVRATINRLQRAADDLSSQSAHLRRLGGKISNAWQGGGSERYQNRYRNNLRQIETKINSLQTLLQRASREVDEWVAADQNGMDQIRKVGRGGMGGMGGKGGGGRVTLPGKPSWERPKIDGHREYTLIHGTEVKVYEGYMKGDLTFKEAVEFLKKDPFKKEYVKGSVTLYENEASARTAVLDGEAATKYGNFGGSLLSAEASGGTKVSFKDGALQAGVEGSAGAYLAKGTYSYEAAGFGAAAVGFIGAEACGSAKAIFDPKAGEVGVKAEVDAFAGGKLEGEISGKGSIAGVEGEVKAQGAISYGVGVTAKADIGVSDGHLRAELELGATLGLGVEFGISFDVDVQQAATNIVNAGAAALDWLF